MGGPLVTCRDRAVRGEVVLGRYGYVHCPNFREEPTKCNVFRQRGCVAGFWRAEGVNPPVVLPGARGGCEPSGGSPRASGGCEPSGGSPRASGGCEPSGGSTG